MLRYCLLFLILAPIPLAAGYRAGVGRVDITPREPIALSGYAGRNRPSEGVTLHLWTKALAIEENPNRRIVILTCDLIGIPREISDVVAARLQKEFHLDRSQILINASHTHSGPMVWPNLNLLLNAGPEAEQRVKEYSQQLIERMVEAASAAFRNMEPANLSIGHGSASFAMNRREKAEGGVRIGVNRAGPVDHDVPVLRVTSANGKLLAILFGYACHNTTLTGDNYQISGDYAGQAQFLLEKSHPGAAALFLALCGGDQNPYPRTKQEHVEQHGKELADAVERVLASPMKPVGTPLRTAFRIVEPRFAPHTREDFEKELKDSNPARVLRAKQMLARYDERRPLHRIPYPVQSIRFGSDLTLVALGGEVVVDYALRVKKELGGSESVIVAGYSNDVMCYIPSRRVLLEGGYEADTSMIYYGMPGPFAEDVEEIIFGGIRDVLRRVGRRVK